MFCRFRMFTDNLSIKIKRITYRGKWIPNVSGLRLPLSHDILINTSRPCCCPSLVVWDFTSHTIYSSILVGHVVFHYNFMLIISKNVDFILITIYLLWSSFVGSYLHRCFQATVAPFLFKCHPYGFPTTCGLLLKRPLRTQSTSLIEPYFRCTGIASILLACPCQEWPPFLYGELFIPEGMAIAEGWLLHYCFQTSKLLILERQVWKCQRDNQKPKSKDRQYNDKKKKIKRTNNMFFTFFTLWLLWHYFVLWACLTVCLTSSTSG